jgi:hypothetical protein
VSWRQRRCCRSALRRLALSESLRARSIASAANARNIARMVAASADARTIIVRFGPDFSSGGSALSTSWMRIASLASSILASSYCFVAAPPNSGTSLRSLRMFSGRPAVPLASGLPPSSLQAALHAGGCRSLMASGSAGGKLRMASSEFPDCDLRVALLYSPA